MQHIRAAALSHKDLFLGFFEAGVFGFGGVLPIARLVVVQKRCQLAQEQFTNCSRSASPCRGRR